MRAETFDHQLEELLVAGVELDLAAQLHPADVLQYKYSSSYYFLFNCDYGSGVADRTLASSPAWSGNLDREMISTEQLSVRHLATAVPASSWKLRTTVSIQALSVLRGSSTYPRYTYH